MEKEAQASVVALGLDGQLFMGRGIQAIVVAFRSDRHLSWGRMSSH